MLLGAIIAYFTASGLVGCDPETSVCAVREFSPPARVACSLRELETGRQCPDPTDVTQILKETVWHYAEGSEADRAYKALVKICQRESRCLKIYGVHETDSHLSGYRGQASLGHLNPQCQHPGSGWATRGPWGLSAASHYSYLPPCYQPEVLDDVWVSADVATRKFLKNCTRKLPVSMKHTRGWCGIRRSKE